MTVTAPPLAPVSPPPRIEPEPPSRTRASSDRLRRAVLYPVLTVLAVITLLPFVWVFSGSLRTTADISANPGAWLPTEATLENFGRLFSQAGFTGYLGNSLVVAGIVVAGNLVAAAAAGYALAKLDFAGRRAATIAVLIALMMPFSAVFVPQFVVTVRLGLVNTLAGIALPSLVLPISIFIVRQFAESIPEELLEAARIDGASELRIFAQVFLPLAGPALATVTIMSFLAAWNNFIWPLLVAQNASTYTLPVGLAATSQASQNVTDYGLVLAGAVVVMLPVLVLFLLLQRYFVQGIVATGLK
ncbi:carbohydrate ABC transporter permease [Rathayibacter sp. VKM Ac-2754]|uniref:carbohydrate ABC transporter permease n=1 Tax=Rathayibacter sp. VKM Ac-2754 TaxID=2609251 RepID=UPI001359C2AC|nr:carbohydrate ABC transporter permease [Rathayibacter sp. VKM Ac-2754]MWV59185.1 ABC transporter permease subunit [Rathayibacter sp. VKM Ac-2754]